MYRFDHHLKRIFILSRRGTIKPCSGLKAPLSRQKTSQALHSMQFFDR